MACVASVARAGIGVASRTYGPYYKAQCRDMHVLVRMTLLPFPTEKEAQQ